MDDSQRIILISTLEDGVSLQNLPHACPLTPSSAVWSLGFAIAVFVVACPCGIGLAAPTALLVGSGLAAKFGILARGGGEAFQEMAQVDVVVFDKTGTLTEGGEPRITDCRILNHEMEEKTVIGMAAEIESVSSHPLANAVRNYGRTSGARSVSGSAFEETAGRGVKARFEALHCNGILGNEAWMQTHGVRIDPNTSRLLDQWTSQGKSIILLAIQNMSPAKRPFHLSAVFAVADAVRTEAAGVIAWLHKQGIHTWMISGDNIATARAVAEMVGIPSSNVIAGVLPYEKVRAGNWSRPCYSNVRTGGKGFYSPTRRRQANSSQLEKACHCSQALEQKMHRRNGWRWDQ